MTNDHNQWLHSEDGLKGEILAITRKANSSEWSIKENFRDFELNCCWPGYGKDNFWGGCQEWRSFLETMIALLHIQICYPDLSEKGMFLTSGFFGMFDFRNSFYGLLHHLGWLTLPSPSNISYFTRYSHRLTITTFGSPNESSINCIYRSWTKYNKTQIWYNFISSWYLFLYFSGHEALYLRTGQLSLFGAGAPKVYTTQEWCIHVTH